MGLVTASEEAHALVVQALKAHELGMFGVSIPTLIAQFEGLVIELQGHSGKTTFNQVKSFVTALATPAGSLGDLLSAFVDKTLFAPFDHGALAPRFSRHATLHGGDVEYGTEVNSRTAILLIDQLRDLSTSDGETLDPSSA